MDFLKSELEKKRKQLDEKVGPKKYFKREELEKQELEKEEFPKLEPKEVIDENNKAKDEPDKFKETEEKSKSSEDQNKQASNNVKVEIMGTNMEEIARLSLNLGKKRDDSQAIIHLFLKYLLELWGSNLNSRDENEKISTQGKTESATYTQTQTYLRPLFKQLKRNKVADDILKHLILICKYLLERNYVKANDAYLQMAIGNSPWPIGVTMVGIHARTGREKIFSQNIAHVLNDETQRKYIQGLKRLITRCQRFFPTDPSRCVEYNA